MIKKDARFIYICYVALLLLTGIVITDIIKQHNQEKQKSEKLDADITKTFAQIDSLKNSRTRRINDSLAQHSEYVYTAENQNKIDSLKIANSELLNNAYNAARNYSLTRVARKNEGVFSEFSDVPLVRNSGIHYNKNKCIIQDFNQKKSAADCLEHNIRRYIDSALIEEVLALQLKLDTLLRQKNSNTRNR